MLVLVLVLGLSGLAASAAQAAPKSKTSVPSAPERSLEERVARMERLLDSQGLVEMVVKLDNLQAELQRLRGEIEVQTHTLGELKARQRELYLDIDRRLVQVERNGVGAGSAGTAASGAAAVATTAGAAAAARPAVKSGEPEAYQKAFDLLRELRYADAVNAFTTFLSDYPDGRYAHIAQYWLAEANYARREFKAAIDDYRTLIKRYPNSPKLAEAMLKVGYSYYELNEFQQSSDTLQQLIARFPGTTEAQQAQNLLRQVKLKQRG
jgi:tol-pal system protein YbgF